MDKYIGKCFERDTQSYDKSVFIINEYDGKFFCVTGYYVQLESCYKRVNEKINPSFLDNSNYHEITIEEFNLVKYLCANPIANRN